MRAREARPVNRATQKYGAQPVDAAPGELRVIDVERVVVSFSGVFYEPGKGRSRGRKTIVRHYLILAIGGARAPWFGKLAVPAKAARAIK